MRGKPAAALGVGLLLSLTSMVASAGLWKGWASDYPKPLLPLTVFPSVDQSAPKQQFRPLVVLRFPASARKENLDAAREVYRWKAGKGDDLTKVFGEREMDKYALDMAFVKTMHHAMEMHDCLARHTSDVADVVLEPFELTKEGETWKRSGAEVGHPASVVIDFYARTEAYSMAMTALTFGPRYESIYNVRTSAVALPATGGAVAGAIPQNPLIVRDPGYPDIDARSGLGIDIVDFFNAPPTKKQSFAGWAKEPPANIPKEAVTEKLPWSSGKYLALPIVSLGLDLDDKAVARKSDREDCAVMANLTRQAIAHLGTVPNVENQRLSQYAGLFDNALAMALAGGAQLSTDDMARAELIKNFYAAEIAFLKQQDARMFKEIMQGPWADAFYAARAEEVSSYSKRKVGIGAMLLVAGAGTAAAAGGAAGTQLLTLGFYQQTENRLSTEMAELRGPQVKLGDFLVEVSSAGQTISAKNSDELRAALKKLYQDKYRSGT